MPVRVNLPDGRIVNFPDGMAPAAIEKAVGELSPLKTPERLSTVSNEEPGTFMGGLMKSLKDQVGEAFTGAKPMLEAAANPRTASDFSQLVLPSAAIGLGASGAAKGASVVGDVAQASRGPLGGAISATGRGVESAGQALRRPSQYIGLGTLYNNPAMGAASIAVPPMMKGAGRMLQRLGGAITPVAEEGIQGVALADLRAAGVGDRAINATMSGRTVIPPKPRFSAADIVQLQQQDPARRAALLEQLKARIGQPPPPPPPPPPVWPTPIPPPPARPPLFVPLK